MAGVERRTLLKLLAGACVAPAELVRVALDVARPVPLYGPLVPGIRQDFIDAYRRTYQSIAEFKLAKIEGASCAPFTAPYAERWSAEDDSDDRADA